MTTATRQHAAPGSVAWDAWRPVRPLQRLLVVFATLALMPAVGATAMRIFPPRDDGAAMLAAFIPYGLIGYLAALTALLVALVRARRRLALTTATVGVALLMVLPISWLAPLFVPDGRPAAGGSFRVMSLNMYKGLADPGTVARWSEQADVVVLVEATPFALKALRSYGWNQRFPYAVGDLDTEISDTAIYSRYPLSEGTLIGRTSFQQWQTSVAVPRLGAVELIAAHPCNPFCGGGRWESEHALLNQVASASSGRPLVMAGDFNAVDDHGPMQALRRLGLESATDLAGAGWLPTWPANRGYPPLLALDHVMVNDLLTATSMSTFAVPGTDHLGVMATIAGTR